MLKENVTVTVIMMASASSVLTGPGSAAVHHSLKEADVKRTDATDARMEDAA